MKKITTFLFAAGFIASVSSCKKCDTCELQCRNANYGSYTQSFCRDEYASDAEFTAVVNNAQLAGATITSINEKEEVCTGGLFYKLRHNDAISSKEESGWSCN